MTDGNEEQIGRILSYLRAQRPRSERVDCPDEEILASYLVGVLGGEAKAGLEVHLADCAVCLDHLCAAHRAAEGDEAETVPQMVLDKAMGLVPPATVGPDFLELVVRLVRGSLELVSTSGQSVLATARAGVRGKGRSSDTAILRVEKELGKFKVAVEVERVEGELCQIAVTVRTRGAPVTDGIRLSLLSGSREQASYLAVQGTAVFDRVAPGEYRLALSQAGHPVGSMRITIRGGHHER